MTGGLRLARTEMMTAAAGDRPDVQNVLILITDGDATIEVSMFTLVGQKGGHKYVSAFIGSIGIPYKWFYYIICIFH